mgnify:CR=1 FL=1
MRGGRDQSRFQSLLYWISHCGLYGEAAMVDEWIGFNPCCIGLAIAANRYRATQTEGCRRFNPCCIGLAIAAPCSAQRHSDCCSFNPCCIGLAIAAVAPRSLYLRCELFQSLLYWISHCGQRCIWEVLWVPWFQSLLYWISHCGSSWSAPAPRRLLGFNPCCIGLAIAARTHLHRHSSP